MRINHDDPTGGHQGMRQTTDTIHQKYYWHNMQRDIKHYVQSCDICQQIKVHRHAPYSKLQPLPVLKAPTELVSIDFITGLPPSKHGGRVYDAILVIVDAFIKYTLYLPCQKDINTDQLLELMIEQVIPIIGILKNLVNDWGSLFTSYFWSTLYHYL